MRTYAALAAALLALAACQPPPRAARTLAPTPHGASLLTDDVDYYGEGPKVVVLGDSLVNSAHDRIHDALPARSVYISSMAGEGFAGGPWTEAFELDSPIMVARAASRDLTGPDVAVVALGTNDAWFGPLKQFDPLPYLTQIVGIFDPACTVGVLIAEDTTAVDYDLEEALAVNAGYRAQADVVVDWRLTVGPGDIDPADGIHLTEQGRTSFASAIAAGVETCIDSIPPPTTTSTSTSTSTTTSTTSTTVAPTTTTTTLPPKPDSAKVKDLRPPTRR